MSDLDKKLEEVLLETVQFTHSNGNMIKLDVSLAVQAAKQAFVDDGWIPYKPYEELPEDKRPIWWSKTPELITLDEHKARTAGLMSGQEFYNRFEKELETTYDLNKYGDIGVTAYGEDDVLEAAKKAAGLE